MDLCLTNEKSLHCIISSVKENMEQAMQKTDLPISYYKEKIFKKYNASSNILILKKHYNARTYDDYKDI